jgi:hypothetical protein
MNKFIVYYATSKGMKQLKEIMADQFIRQDDGAFVFVNVIKHFMRADEIELVAFLDVNYPVLVVRGV